MKVTLSELRQVTNALLSHLEETGHGELEIDSDFAGLLNLLVVMGLAVFVAAGTPRFVEGWVFLALFFGAALVITIFLAKSDPALLERRTQAGPTGEKEWAQRVIQGAASLAWRSSLPSASHAKTASMSRVHDVVTPAPTAELAPDPSPAVCEPRFTAADLLAYASARIEAADAELARIFAKGSPTEADMIELQKVMTERRTATQLIVNLVDVLHQPTDDLPLDDTACSPADLGQ